MGQRGLRARGTRPHVSVELFLRKHQVLLGQAVATSLCLTNCMFSWVQLTHYMSVSLREEMLKSGHATNTNFKKQMTVVQSQGAAEGRKVLWSWVTRGNLVAGKQEKEEALVQGETGRR